MASLVGKILKKRYRIDGFLGRGGMAEVYKVWDTQRGVPLAMKVLREDLAEDIVFMRRFEREAHNLARLQHPNIVRCYGLEREGRTAFMLMDYIDGQTLRTEIFDAHAPLTMRRVLEVMQPVCSALNYAHQLDMVHCDVKSANIMIHNNGTIYLTDFGIARGMDAVTSTMVGVGTPAYMAPELIKGQDPTPQTDIYALGIVLYEMLTGGERPFTGERATITGTTTEKVRWEHIRMQPVPVLKYNTKVSVQLEEVVQRCLKKNASERYVTTMELLDGLNKNIEKTIPSSGEKKQEGRLKPPQKQVETIRGTSTRVGQKSEQKNVSRKNTATLGIVLIAIIGLSLIIGIPLVNKNTKIHATQTAYTLATMNVKSTATAAYEATATEVYGITATAEYKSKPQTEYYPEINQNFTTIYSYETSKPIQLTEYKSDDYLNCNESSFGYLKNFIVQMTVRNPSDVSSGFDYGILFRHFGGNNQYRLGFDSDRGWSLYNITGDTSTAREIDYDYMENFYVGSTDSNKIKLIAYNDVGYLYVNDEFISKLDLSDRSNSGDIYICTDFYLGFGKTGNVIQIDSLVLKAIKN